MSCELYDDVLDEYVDGARAADRVGAPDPRLAAFESHLSGCARCQALVADFTSIRRTAAALDEHLPPPRLWAKIASSIEDEEAEAVVGAIAGEHVLRVGPCGGCRLAGAPARRRGVARLAARGLPH